MPREKIFERLGLKPNTKKEKMEVFDFDQERPKYERLRKNHPKMDELLTLHDNVEAHMNSSARDAKDADALVEVRSQIEELYQEINRKK